MPAHGNWSNWAPVVTEQYQLEKYDKLLLLESRSHGHNSSRASCGFWSIWCICLQLMWEQRGTWGGIFFSFCIFLFACGSARFLSPPDKVNHLVVSLYTCHTTQFIRLRRISFTLQVFRGSIAKNKSRRQQRVFIMLWQRLNSVPKCRTQADGISLKRWHFEQNLNPVLIFN